MNESRSDLFDVPLVKLESAVNLLPVVFSLHAALLLSPPPSLCNTSLCVCFHIKGNAVFLTGTIIFLAAPPQRAELFVSVWP